VTFPLLVSIKLVFWVGVVWLAYVYAGYPCFLWLLGLVRRVHPASDSGPLPSVSVLIAARNEEKDIAWKIRQTLAWDYPADRLRVLVASDASEDGTDRILEAIKDERFSFVRMTERVGKNAALNRLVQLAAGDLLFFTDANSDIDAQCLRRMVRHFADSRVGCVTGVEENPGEKKAAALSTGGRTYLNYESVVNQLESRMGSVLVCDGSIFLMRRCLYGSVKPELANDLELPIRIGYNGLWVLYEPSARSLEHATHSFREEFSRRKRICGQGILGMWSLRRHLRGLRAWQFFSRKLLRWFSLVPCCLIFVASVAQARNPWFAALLAPQIAFLIFALLGWRATLRGKPTSALISLPFYFLLVNLAAVVGIVQALLGRRFAVWEIASLSRGKERVA